MASGNNNFNNSNRPPPPTVKLTPERFLANQRWLQQQAAAFTQQNVRGLQAYLDQKITEGERAKRQMEYLHWLTNPNNLLMAPPAENITVPPQHSNANYIVNPQAVAGPSNVVNGNDFVMNPHNLYTVNQMPVNINPSSEQLPTSSGERLEVDAQQVALPFPIGEPNYGVVRTVQVQNSQHYQPPRSDANLNQFPIRQSIQPSAAAGYPSASQVATRPHPQQQPRTIVNTGPQPTSFRDQLSLMHPWSSSNQAHVSGLPSGAGIQQGVSSIGSSRQFRNTFSSSSLAGALGESINPKIQTRSTISQPTHASNAVVVQQSLETTKGKEREKLQPLSNHEEIPTISISGRLNQDATSQKSSGLESKSDSLPASSDAMPDEQFKQAQAKLISQVKETHAASGSAPNAQNVVAAVQEQYPKPTTYAPQVMSRSGPQQNIRIIPPSVSFQPINPVVPNPYASASSAINETSPRGNTYTGFGSGVQVNANTSTDATSATQNAAFRSAHQNANTAIPSTTRAIFASNIQKYYQQSTTYPNSMPAPHSDQISPGVSNFNGPDASARLNTPPPGPVTPASANRKTLARDILRALNKMPEKRKALTPNADMEGPPAKRQAVDPVPDGGPLVVEDVFYTLPVSPLPANSSGRPRIEEADNAVAERAEVVEVSTPPKPPINDHVHDVPELAPVTFVASDVPMPRARASSPPRSMVESRASSEAELDEDNALQPLEESGVPLFLPEPGPAPGPGSPRLPSRKDGPKTVGRSTLARSDKLRRQHGHKMEVYVEVPTLTAKQRRLYSKSHVATVGRLDPKDPSSSRLPQEKLGTSANEQPVDEGRHRLAKEAAAVAASRLRKRPCLWNDCFHVANSANSLIFHISEHVESFTDKDKVFPCWWGDCIRRFNKREALEQHLRNHVRKSIFCGHEGCDAQFVNPLELLAHVESNHPPGSKLKPSTKPFMPLNRLLQPLGTMLAYNVVNLPVEMARISKERRAKLGPWVAKNCFGSVNIGVPRFNARNQPQRRRPVDEPKLLGEWQDRYDFVEPWGSTYPQNCADLESSKATEEIENGLLLAPDVAGPRGPLQEQLLTSRMDRIKPSDSQKYIVKAERDQDELEAEVSGIKMEDQSADVSQQEPPLPTSSQGPVGRTPYQDFLGVAEPVPVA